MTRPDMLSADQASALQSLGYLYLQHGQLGRGLALVVLADRSRPGEISIMRTLVYAYLKNGEPANALGVIARLEKTIGAIEPASPLQLLKAQALWLAGEKSLGRRVFERFNRARRASRQVSDRHGEVLSLERNHAARNASDEDEDVLVLGEGDIA